MCTHLDSMCTPSTLSTGKKYDWAFPTNQLLLSTPVLRNSASSSPFGLCCISLPRACVASLYDVLPGLYAASLYDAPHGACVASLFYAPPVTSSNIKMMILCTIDRYDTIKTRPASRHKKDQNGYLIFPPDLTESHTNSYTRGIIVHLILGR